RGKGSAGQQETSSDPPDNLTDTVRINPEPVVCAILTLLFLPATRGTAYFNAKSSICGLCTFKVVCPRSPAAVEQQGAPRARYPPIPGNPDTITPAPEDL